MKVKKDKIETYNSIFELFLNKVPSEELLNRYFNYFSEDNYDDEGSEALQNFVSDNLKKEFLWCSSIGIMESVIHIVNEAISNGNIENFNEK